MLGNEYQKVAQLYENKDACVTVYKAYSQTAQKEVVIKEQVFQILGNVNFALTEAMLQTRLDHPNICQIYDAKIEQHGTGYMFSIVIEYMERGDLCKDISKRKEHQCYWSDDELLVCLAQLSSALEYAEKRGVAHRDIKPQNIFIANDGTLKIGDFGSSSNNAFKIMQNTVMGSPFYLSPELKGQYQQIMSPSSYNPFKSDVFSLGVTISYMGLLEPDMSFLSGSDINRAVHDVLGRMNTRYPNTVHCLTAMFNPDPANRISFADLHTRVLRLIQTPLPQSAPNVACFETIQSPAPTASPARTSGSMPAVRLARIAKPCSICSNPVASDDAWNQYIRSQNQQYSMQFPLVCSEQCYNEACRRMSQVCCICGSTGFAPLQVASTEQYQYYQPYFNFLCSESCLATFINWSQSPNGNPKCACCQEEIFPLMQTLNKSFSIALECHHRFHDYKCLLTYLAYNSSNFHKSDVQYHCPICRFEISQDFIANYRNQNSQFAYEMQVLFSDSCSRCGTLENVQTPQCEHRMCQSCGAQLNWICPYHSST